MFNYIAVVGTCKRRFTNYADAVEFIRNNWVPGLVWKLIKLH